MAPVKEPVKNSCLTYCPTEVRLLERPGSTQNSAIIFVITMLRLMAEKPELGIVRRSDRFANFCPFSGPGRF